MGSNVADIGVCEHFYCEVLGMRVVWRPDEQNVYLTNGADNLALHQ
ncbi:MAG: VOC family protein, partial [Gammaproteobacteria bacterium]|nr:VOC family protein [Gammaproteobacteria bacterium]